MIKGRFQEGAKESVLKTFNLCIPYNVLKQLSMSTLQDRSLISLRWHLYHGLIIVDSANIAIVLKDY